MESATPADFTALIAGMTLQDKADLCSGADHWHTERMERYGIEPLLMTDGPHGLRHVIDGDDLTVENSDPATCFPTAALVGCSFDRALAAELGAALGAEARDNGIGLVLGPGVNIKRSPLCGRNFEYYAEDPYLAGELSAAFIGGLQHNGVGACIKHYAANSQEFRRLVCNSAIDNRALHEIYLEAFRIAVAKSDPAAVMSSYNRVNGEYSGESPYLIGEVLRGRFGFSGAVISDWGAVCDRVAGIRAGLDLEMPGKTSATAADIVQAVQNGSLDEALLDACCARVLALVARCAPQQTAPASDLEAHHQLARRAAAESAVLMKNDNDLLPFDDAKPFAVIGRFAKQARYQGAGSSKVVPHQLPSALDELAVRGLVCPYADGYNADGSTNDALVAEARKAAVEAGRAVIFAGLPDIYESEGYDREHLRLPEGMLKLIDVVSAACPNVAVYLMLGAPVMLPFADRVGAIVCGYLGGQGAGPAAIDVLTGRVNPGGHLAESWPLKLADTPCYAYYGKNRKVAEYREGLYVGYRYYGPAGVPVQFCFGHGLSYTAFSVGDFRCDSAVLSPGESLTVRLSVRNTGRRAGSVAVQLYLSKKDDNRRVLRQFEKVFLFAGEQREVLFTLTHDDFACHNPTGDTRCVVPGDYTLHIGFSSENLCAAADLSILTDRGVTLPPYPPATTANSLGDEEFYRLLGAPPYEEPRLPFTLNSTLNDLRTRLPGKIVCKVIESMMTSQGGDLNDELIQKNYRSMCDMPIRAVCAMSHGMLSKNLAKAIVSLSNRKVFKGIYYALKK